MVVWLLLLLVLESKETVWSNVGWSPEVAGVESRRLVVSEVVRSEMSVL